MDGPPVVDEDVEDTEDENKECGRPLGLETNGNHRACCETNQGDEDTDKAPFATEGETNEEEDKQNTAC